MEQFLSFFEQMPAWQKLVWVISCLSFVWILELVVPLFNHDYKKLRHDGVNLLFLSFSLTINVLVGIATVGVFFWNLQQGESVLFSLGDAIFTAFQDKEDGKFKIEYFDFNYLSSRAKFKYQNGKQKLSTTANFRLKKDSVIWVSISKLGIEGARVLATKDGVQMIDKLSKSYYVYDYAQLSQMYGVEIMKEL